MIKLHSQFRLGTEIAPFSEIPSTSRRDLRDFVNKLQNFKDLEEVISYSGTDECPICKDRRFRSPETRFIINQDCRHIICSYCMYSCLSNDGVNGRRVNTMVYIFV